MHDLIIIGAGPAGLTAGLYAGRYRLNTLIFERMSVGGQIILSPDIENYPGFPQGIATGELIEKFRKQVAAVGVPVEMQEILEISPVGKHMPVIYTVRTHEKIYEAKSIIIACGAQPKKLGVKGEEKLIGRGVSYCGTCDGPLFKNKEIVVVGGGDRALEEALFLSGYASKVTLVHRRQELRASEILVEKADKNPKISFILDTVIEEIGGQHKVDSIKLRNLKTGSVDTLAAGGIFIFVGILPNTQFLKNLIPMDESGFIHTDSHMKTALTGIFACGDCCKKELYQVISACAEGAEAAFSAHKYLLGT